MFTRATIVLAIVLGTATSALAASKQESINRANSVYVNRPNGIFDSRGVFVGADPDAGVRSQLQRDPNLGRY